MARVLQRCVILASFVFRECAHQRVQRAGVLLEVFGAPLLRAAGEIDRYDERFATSSRGSSEPFPGRACSPAARRGPPAAPRRGPPAAPRRGGPPAAPRRGGASSASSGGRQQRLVGGPPAAPRRGAASSASSGTASSSASAGTASSSASAGAASARAAPRVGVQCMLDGISEKTFERTRGSCGARAAAVRYFSEFRIPRMRSPACPARRRIARGLRSTPPACRW